jgi:glycosyltransferase involved in cell wall biosynthesis
MHGMLNILGLGTFPPYAGGSALSFFQLLEGFGKLGHRIRVLTPTAEPALGNLPRAGEHSPYVEVTRFPIPFLQSGNYPASVDCRTIEGGSVRNLFPRMIENERPDLIMVGRETLASYVPDIAEHYQIPFIQRVTGGATLGILRGEYPPDLATSLIDALKRANVVVTPARHLSERMTQLGLPDVKVIPNAIDLDRFSPGQPSRELQ